MSQVQREYERDMTAVEDGVMKSLEKGERMMTMWKNTPLSKEVHDALQKRRFVVQEEVDKDKQKILYTISW